ncbi:hypothetical protein H6775_03235 [Candidatus Nomurabacteria bacterium]|nr:hypothetical protein [Candidatus Nomurabacteria bacterium]
MSEKRLSKSFRFKKNQDAYESFLEENKDKPAFHDWEEKLIKEYDYWLLIANGFPADRVAEKHDLLIPKRVFGEFDEINDDEYKELLVIKKELNDTYDACWEQYGKARSRPMHYHLHFVIYKSHNWEWEKDEN